MEAFDPAAAIARRAAKEAAARAAAAAVLEAARDGRYILEGSTRCGLHAKPRRATATEARRRRLRLGG